MAITTSDGYIAAAKQTLAISKTAAVTTVAQTRYNVRGASGTPGGAALALTGTPSGALLTDALSGFPTITNFAGGATGYLTRVQWGNTVAGRVELWDMLYGCNVTTAQLGTLQTLTLSSQPSILGRCPDGAGVGNRIFVEISTTMAATATTIAVTYTNSAGTTGRSTGATASLSGFVAGRWVDLPLQAGDSGVQKIETIVIGGATNASGSLNVIIARPLWTNGTRIANSGSSDGIDMTGMPIVYDTSAISLTTIADSTSSGLPDFLVEIASG